MFNHLLKFKVTDNGGRQGTYFYQFLFFHLIFSLVHIFSVQYFFQFWQGTYMGPLHIVIKLK